MIDDELAGLLSEHAETTRSLRTDERQRLMERLGIGADDGEGPAAEPGGSPVADITARQPQQLRSRRRRLPIAAAAAIIVMAAIGLALALVGTGEESGVAIVAEPTIATPTPAPTATPVPPPVCPGSVVEFIAAIDDWDGIDAWAGLIDERRPEPDLQRLAGVALTAWRIAAPGDGAHADLEVPDTLAGFEPGEAARELSARRAGPTQAVFDAIRLAAGDPASIMSPCGAAIEALAAELGSP